MTGSPEDQLHQAVADRLGGRVEEGRRAFRDRMNFWANWNLGRLLFGWGPVSVIARPDERAVMLQFHSDSRLAVDLVYNGPHGFEFTSHGEIRGYPPEDLPRDEVLRLVHPQRPFQRLFLDSHLIEFDTTYGFGPGEPDRIVRVVEALREVAVLLE